MKKTLTTLIMMAMLAVLLPVMTLDANAQTRYERNRYERRYERNDKSFYRRHRNLINIGIGTGAGTLIGALIGGKKGALIGAAAGAGGSALYTYKINPKTKRYKRVYYRRR